MSDTKSIPALVAAAREGDAGALDALYRQFAPVVHGVLLGYGQVADADDLTQDVFETVFRRLHELRDAAAFPGWIVSIARHAGLDARRRRAPMTGLDLEQRPGRDNPENHVEAERSLRAILALPEAYRETLLLRLVEGMSGPEIAARTGLTPGSVRVNLHRGMAMLRATLMTAAEMKGAST